MNPLMWYHMNKWTRKKKRKHFLIHEMLHADKIQNQKYFLLNFKKDVLLQCFVTRVSLENVNHVHFISICVFSWKVITINVLFFEFWDIVATTGGESYHYFGNCTFKCCELFYLRVILFFLSLHQTVVKSRYLTIRDIYHRVFSSTRKCPAHLLYTGTSLGAVQTAGVLNRALLIVINIILAMLCSGSRQKIYVQWFGTRSQSSVTVLQFEINQLSLVCSEQYSAFLNEIKPSQK